MATTTTETTTVTGGGSTTYYADGYGPDGKGGVITTPGKNITTTTTTTSDGTTSTKTTQAASTAAPTYNTTNTSSWKTISQESTEKSIKVRGVTTSYFIITIVRENTVTGEQVKMVYDPESGTTTSETIKEGKGVDLKPKTETLDMQRDYAGPSEGLTVPPTKASQSKIKQKLVNLAKAAAKQAAKDAVKSVTSSLSSQANQAIASANASVQNTLSPIQQATLNANQQIYSAAGTLNQAANVLETVGNVTYALGITDCVTLPSYARKLNNLSQNLRDNTLPVIDISKIPNIDLSDVNKYLNKKVNSAVESVADLLGLNPDSSATDELTAAKENDVMPSDEESTGADGVPCPNMIDEQTRQAKARAAAKEAAQKQKNEYFETKEKEKKVAIESSKAKLKALNIEYKEGEDAGLPIIKNIDEAYSSGKLTQAKYCDVYKEVQLYLIKYGYADFNELPCCKEGYITITDVNKYNTSSNNTITTAATSNTSTTVVSTNQATGTTTATIKGESISKTANGETITTTTTTTATTTAGGGSVVTETTEVKSGGGSTIRTSEGTTYISADGKKTFVSNNTTSEDREVQVNKINAEYKAEKALVEQRLANDVNRYPNGFVDDPTSPEYAPELKAVDIKYQQRLDALK